MIRAIAIDDEPMALGVIRKFTPQIPFLELADCFTNAFDAIAYLKHQKTDLIFLDIQMPDIGGMALLEGLTERPLVIFTTAHSEYAVKSFELNAVDYLLKPFSLERFEQACNKALNSHLWRQQEREFKPLSFFIKSGYDSIRIFFDQVLYAESVGNYVQFFLKDRRVTSRLTMIETEKVLTRPDFIRVHRRFIVAKKDISRIDKKSLTLGKLQMPIGETYWETIKELFSK